MLRAGEQEQSQVKEGLCLAAAAPWPYRGLSIVPHQLEELLEELGVLSQDASPLQGPQSRQSIPQALQPQGAGCKRAELHCSPHPETALQQSWHKLLGLRTTCAKGKVSLLGTQEPKSVHCAGAEINISFQNSCQDPYSIFPGSR